MKKIMKRIGLCLCFAGAVWAWNLINDRQALNRELIRLHVVANSDSDADQALKLQIKNAVVEYLEAAMADVTDVEAARAYIQQNLPKIRQTVNDALEKLGYEPTASVSFGEEIFGKRVYDTFSLPSGVYQSLRITLGEGAGRNWWCVAFPQLCLPATTEEFRDQAVSAGFSPELVSSLEGKEPYEIRFYLLDMLGKLQAIFHRG